MYPEKDGVAVGCFPEGKIHDHSPKKRRVGCIAAKALIKSVNFLVKWYVNMI